jgi:hypothetical protein
VTGTERRMIGLLPGLVAERDAQADAAKRAALDSRIRAARFLLAWSRGNG